MRTLFSLVGWIFALAFLSVGLRNFEVGLSMDAPLYASIARSLAAGQAESWFWLKSSIPEFQPYFAEHPHLGYWVMALVFKILPAADWSARIPSHLFYVSSLVLLYFWVARLARSARAGALTVILIWAFPILSNFFSTAYLDPQVFFFGLLAVFALETSTRASEKHFVAWATLSGLALAACALTKGLTVLGFGPVMAWLVVSRARGRLREAVTAALFCLSSALALVGLYLLALYRSDVPHFLETYVQRQWSGRFALESDWRLLFRLYFYKELARETHYLIVLVPLALLWKRRRLPERDAWLVPLVLLASFVLMYFPASRVGHQYWILMLPWAAWIVALGLDVLLPDSWSESRLRLVTGSLSVALVLGLQYVPFQRHKARVPAIAVDIAASARQDPTLKRLRLDVQAAKDTFLRSSVWNWYGGLPVVYVNSAAVISGQQSLEAGDVLVIERVSVETRLEISAALKKQGFCLKGETRDAGYWAQCS